MPNILVEFGACTLHLKTVFNLISLLHRVQGHVAQWQAKRPLPWPNALDKLTASLQGFPILSHQWVSQWTASPRLDIHLMHQVASYLQGKS